MLFLGVPIAAIAAAFFLSWWWLTALPLAIVGMRLSKTAYDTSILQAAANDKSSFCLLYWSSQVAVWDAEAKKDYYRNSETTFTYRAQRQRERELKEKDEEEEEHSFAMPAVARQASVDSDRLTDYHADLDEMTAECANFIRARGLGGKGWPADLHAEAIVYAACCVGKLRGLHKFSLGGWNSFKHSVENRMLAIQADPEPEPKHHDPRRLVSYASSYASYLGDRERLANPALEQSRPLIAMLSNDIGATGENSTAFADLFWKLAQQARKDATFKAWLVFGDKPGRV